MLKYFWPGKPVSFLCTLVIVSGIFIVLGHFSQTEFKTCQIEFELEAEQPVSFELYYDVGRGFNEVDHQSVMIDLVNEPTKVNFCIPIINELKRVRFDPAREHAKMKIFSVTLFYGNDNAFEVPLDTVEPENDILQYTFDGEKLVFETTPDGEDPMFLLTELRSVQLGSRMKDPFHYLFWMMTGILTVLFCGFVYRYFFQAK